MFLEYGVNDSGHYIHISQVDRGRVSLQCPYCEQGLIARKGKVMAHHFAHDGETCLISKRDFESLGVPHFERFHTHIDTKVWEQLQAFYAHKHANTPMLLDHKLIRSDNLNRPNANYELTDLGKIPFGLVEFTKFAEFQLTAITKKHNELSKTVHLAHYGKPNPYKIASIPYLLNPTPDMVQPALVDLKIYRSQLARIVSCDLYLLKIISDIPDLYKIGVTTDIDRRISEIERTLAQHITVRKIEVDQRLSYRGTIEGYALHRYQKQQILIDTLTEYFVFDARMIDHVRHDFISLGHYDLADDTNGIIKASLNKEKPEIEIEIGNTGKYKNTR